ncbi:DUF1192 domain-containing protein [Roseibium limicola]|uniref:DUF1192 domain-containing protein n=1 Tax=Roseibium limicola TaxID=2816037 RepID=A0A939ESR8_9HYPH|nr:DUF1192 domain-containing protein [Roseibium limicola]MBO0346938.1 DUF1192 domain-containing protein [Roseibium limicola]
MTDDNLSTRPSLILGTILVGEDLENLSEEELTQRIEALEAEIERTQQSLGHKKGVRANADAIFGTKL